MPGQDPPRRPPPAAAAEANRGDGGGGGGGGGEECVVGGGEEGGESVTGGCGAGEVGGDRRELRPVHGLRPDLLRGLEWRAGIGDCAIPRQVGNRNSSWQRRLSEARRGINL